MPKYRYTARDSHGKQFRGTAEAADEDALYQQLRTGGSYLVECRIREGSMGGVRLRIPQVADFCRQLGTLLSAGVSLVRALSIMANEEGLPPAVKGVYERLLTEIRKGTALSDAMAAAEGAFPELLVNMVRSAEASGSIDKTAKRMASHYEKEHRLNQQVRSALTYPMILGILIVVVVAFIFIYIIPQFSSLFDQMESLPGPTVALLAISGALQKHGALILLLTAAGVVLLGVLLRTPPVRLATDRYRLHMPVIGKLQRVICTARFARTLSSLYSSGMPIVMALQVGRNTIGNSYIASQFDAVQAMVRAGEPLSRALDTVDGFERKLSATVLVGEETGSLDEMLDTISESMDYEAENATKKMMTLLEPVMIILMALIVGFILIGVMLPIFQSYSTIEAGAGGF